MKLPPNVIVHHRDGNAMNNLMNNLEIMSHGNHSKYHYNHPYLARVREIGQYSTTDRLLKTYKSISEASRESDIDISSIGKVAKSRYPERITAGGYIWKFI